MGEKQKKFYLKNSSEFRMFILIFSQSNVFTHHFFCFLWCLTEVFSKMFPCPDCSFSSPNKRRLKTHIRETHRREPALCTFICRHCNSSFTASKNLLRHLRNVHKFSKNMRYNACPKIYGNESSLQNHISHEHPSTPSRVRKEANWVSVPQVSNIVSAPNSHLKILELDV